jgi:V-type H+-transporting ATPase subunit d
VEYLIANSNEPLTTFIRYMTTNYMIDNTVNIIEGMKNGYPIDELLANTNPIGYFKQMREIKVIDPDDFAELYKVVLIDTPVGPYFLRFLEANLADIGE